MSPEIHCPICGGTKIGDYMIPGREEYDGHVHDPNEYRCEACKKNFYIACPVCGWECSNES